MRDSKLLEAPRRASSRRIVADEDGAARHRIAPDGVEVIPRIRFGAVGLRELREKLARLVAT